MPRCPKCGHPSVTTQLLEKHLLSCSVASLECCPHCGNVPPAGHSLHLHVATCKKNPRVIERFNHRDQKRLEEAARQQEAQARKDAPRSETSPDAINIRSKHPDPVIALLSISLKLYLYPNPSAPTHGYLLGDSEGPWKPFHTSIVRGGSAAPGRIHYPYVPVALVVMFDNSPKTTQAKDGTCSVEYEVFCPSPTNPFYQSVIIRIDPPNRTFDFSEYYNAD